MKAWILLPAYNEEASIQNLIPEISNNLNDLGIQFHIVVVNDGSTDRTGSILAELSDEYHLTTITHEINRGLGETERDGFEYIAFRCTDEDIIFRLDCDDTHGSEFMGPMLQKIQAGSDVVSASRFKEGGGQIGVPAFRKFISFNANLFMKIVFNIPGLKDYTCGFRAYRGQVIRDAISIFGNNFIQLKGLGFTSTLEMIVKLKILGCTFDEVAFTLRYDKKIGDSKMVSSITTAGYLVMALLYHWPFGGWRRHYKGLRRLYRRSRPQALGKFSMNELPVLGDQGT